MSLLSMACIMMVWKIIYNFFFFFLFPLPGDPVLLAESGSISGRLPDDPGGFTCMWLPSANNATHYTDSSFFPSIGFS